MQKTQSLKPNVNQDIYEVLKQEHQQVKDLFRQLLEKRQLSQDVFFQIENLLELHMEGEEKFFYPAIKQNETLTFLVNEAVSAHEVATDLMTEIEEMNISDEMWLAKVKVLSDIVDRHIEEEESQIFEQAHNVLGTAEAKEIANTFLQHKQQALESQM